MREKSQQTLQMDLCIVYRYKNTFPQSVRFEYEKSDSENEWENFPEEIFKMEFQCFFWKRFLNEFYHSLWVATRFLFCLAKYVIRGINVILVCIDFCCLYAHSKKNILYQKALNVFNVLKFKQNCLDTTSHHR